MKDTRFEFGEVDSQNLRMTADGTALTAVGQPVKVAGGRFVPLCRVGGCHTVCCRDNELYVVTDGVENPTLTAVLPAGSEVYCGAGWGDRAVVMTSAGAQHLVCRGNEVICLGSMPALPPVEVALTATVELSETVAGLALAEPDSLREGRLGVTDNATLSSLLTEAWGRLTARATSLGAAIVGKGGGVAVEVRRLDSSGGATGSRGVQTVMSTSSPSVSYASLTDGRIEPFTLTVSAMKLAVEVGQPDAEVVGTWGDDSGEIEIAVGATGAVTAEWGFRVEGSRLSVTTHLASATVDPAAPRQSMLRVSGKTAGSYVVDIPAKVTEGVEEVLAPDGFTARATATSGDVVIWGNIDGRPGEVAMTRAGSPMTVTSRAVLSLSPIVALLAAPRLGSAALSPGCAHFYAFTETGILNVSVGSNRGVPTASLLDNRGVRDGSAVTDGDERVLVVAGNGRQLLSLRGGRVDTLLTNDGERWTGVGYEPKSGEVYILDELGNIISYEPGRGRKSGRPLPFAAEGLRRTGDTLYILSDEGLYDGTRTDETAETTIRWRGNYRPEMGRAVRSVRLDLEAPGGFEGILEIRPTAFTPSRRGLGRGMTRLHIKGAPAGPVAIRLFLPVRAAAEAELEGVTKPGTRFFSITGTTNK